MSTSKRQTLKPTQQPTDTQIQNFLDDLNIAKSDKAKITVIKAIFESGRHYGMQLITKAHIKAILNQ